MWWGIYVNIWVGCSHAVLASKTKNNHSNFGHLISTTIIFYHLFYRTLSNLSADLILHSHQECTRKVITSASIHSNPNCFTVLWTQNLLVLLVWFDQLLLLKGFVSELTFKQNRSWDCGALQRSQLLLSQLLDLITTGKRTRKFLRNKKSLQDNFRIFRMNATIMSFKNI